MRATAGYSGTPLARKLGIRPHAVVGLLAAPPGIEELLAPLPDGVALRRRAQGRLDVILLFAARRVALEGRFGQAVEALDSDGGLWVAWPKKSSKIPTDLDFDRIQRLGLESGLVDNKICAIDQVWTALRFVVRLVDRPARRAARQGVSGAGERPA